MSASTAAAILLIGVPIGFNVAFGMLAARFDYPDVLRKPTHEVLARFREGGRSLVLLWWAFALTAVLMVPLVVLLSNALPGADPALLGVATTIGVLGIVIGPVLMLCALEFVGRHEPGGWKVAERLTPPAYVAWSLWLVATGVALAA